MRTLSDEEHHTFLPSVYDELTNANKAIYSAVCVQIACWGGIKQTLFGEEGQVIGQLQPQNNPPPQRT